MSDCGIEPGDILLLVSNSSKIVAKLKQLAQSLTSSRSKHGHREVISVFVCTGKNKYGVICHNFERQLSLSTDAFITSLQKKTIEELSISLLNYCSKEFSADQIKKTLAYGSLWMSNLAAAMTDAQSTEELIEQFLSASRGDKEKLIDLIVHFWQASGQSEILPTIQSSLLVFKPTDRKIKQEFLNAYKEQVKLTKQWHDQGKNRTSLWALIRAFFSLSSQDEKDKAGQRPDELTFCSKNLMQVLNQINPNLINRGRHVLPKSLEAGLREGTVSKASLPQLETDDFEGLIAEQEQLLAPFKMAILPSCGTELMRSLLAVIDKEVVRIEHKFWANAADRQKAADIKHLILAYRDPKFQSYPIHLQVETALELIATLLPSLQRKTGLFGLWISSSSYARVRAFLRTQAIFDGDIRQAVEKLKANPPNREELLLAKQPHDFGSEPVYIFSDWSFSSWSPNTCELMLEHMRGLIRAGASLYTWEDGQLVKMTKELLEKTILGEDFENLLAAKLKPATRQAIIKQAKLQNIDTSKLRFIDYKESKNLTKDPSPIENSLNKVAALFARKIDPYHLNQAKLKILDIEIANAEEDKQVQDELNKIKESISLEKNSKNTNFQSGIDTKALVYQVQKRQAVFKPINLMTSVPAHSYYRNEVYSELLVPEKPSSPFQYFELLGMNATDDLMDCQYRFHAREISQRTINKRQAESKQILFIGEKILSLTGDWQALPSLDPGEVLLDFAITGKKRTDFEIKYSKKNHLYYIRLSKPSTEAETVGVKLLLRMPKNYRANPILNTLAPNPKYQAIHRLLMKYLKFGKDDGSLMDGPSIHNGHEYLSEARRLNSGSCRLRAIAFKEEMNRLHPTIPVSIIINPDHCFIEIELDGLWQRYCLGGYRNSPSFVEHLRENTLESCAYSSKKQRFFNEIQKPLSPKAYPTARNPGSVERLSNSIWP